jgi:hypothetical protein
MKKIFSIGLISLCLFACKKEEVQKFIPEKFTATVNNEGWIAITRTIVLKNNQFYIIGISPSGTIVDLTTFGSEVKSYSLNLALFDTTRSANCQALYKPSANVIDKDIYIGKQGNINITEINTKDKTLSATFDFKLYKINVADSIVLDSVILTNGNITSVKYTEQ